MASRKNDPGGEKHGTIELAYVRLSGNDATLQEALRSFNSLISRGATGGALSGVTHKRVNSLPSASASGNGTAQSAHEDAIDIESPNSADDTDTGEVLTARPKAPRKYSRPKAIAIDTEAGTSLAAYIEQFSLDSEQDRYVALAGWLKAHRDDMALTTGLVMTLYNSLGWNLLADISMPLRRLASKKFQMLENVGRGEYKITHLGENRLKALRK